MAEPTRLRSNNSVSTIGVDGCPRGWICALRPRESIEQTIEIKVVPSFTEILSTWPDAFVAIDMLIGLPSSGARACDRLARARLGLRRASVFPAPLRCSLQAPNQPQASAMQRAIDGRGLSAQAWNIVAKIRDVDSVITPDLQGRIIEAHPELSFAAMAGGMPMQFSKKAKPGRLERERALLAGLRGAAAALDTPPPRGASHDDLLDALAVLWTADRHAAGQAQRLPEAPARDQRGLSMEIWF